MVDVLWFNQINCALQEGKRYLVSKIPGKIPGKTRHESFSKYHHGLTDQSFSTDQTYNNIWQTLFTWLWRWLPLRLSKRQSQPTVLFRTTLTRTITQYELILSLFDTFTNLREYICCLFSPYGICPLIQPDWPCIAERTPRVWQRGFRSKASEDEFLVGIQSCFERNVLKQVLCSLGLPTMLSLLDTFSNPRECFRCLLSTYSRCHIDRALQEGRL